MAISLKFLRNKSLALMDVKISTDQSAINYPSANKYNKLEELNKIDEGNYVIYLYWLHIQPICFIITAMKSNKHYWRHFWDRFQQFPGTTTNFWT